MINPDALQPLLDGDNARHWAAAAQGELAVLHCGACGHFWFPASHTCPNCLSESVDWATVSGKATLVSWCDFHKAYFKNLRERVPYTVLLVQLAEGPRLYGNLVGSDAANLKIGMPMEAVFTAVSLQAGLVNYRIAS